MTIPQHILELWFVIAVFIGLLAYAAQVPWLVDLRLLMHREARGMVGILVDALIGAMVLMVVIFGWSVVSILSPRIEVPPRTLYQCILATLFAIKPVWILTRLVRWRLKETNGESIGVAASKAINHRAPEPPWDGHTERRRPPSPDKET